MTTGLFFAGLAAPGGGYATGFKSFGSPKRSLGSPGAGNVWHHVVEQRLAGQFGPEAIHNAGNVVAVSRDVNQRIANYYSSKQSFTQGLTVRKWLEAQPYSVQYEFGERVLHQASKGLPLQ